MNRIEEMINTCQGTAPYQIDKLQELPLSELVRIYRELGIDAQIDYDKFYLYSIITHSTAIEGSTVTELENQLLFDEGITAKGRSLQAAMTRLQEQHLREDIIAFVDSMFEGGQKTEKVDRNDTKDDTKELSERQKVIVSLIQKNDTITIDEMIQKTKVSSITIKRDLAVLQELNIIKREGGRKQGRWVIVVEGKEGKI